eukprot:809150-Pleurochrysis_carterae.AAC.1
MPTELGELSLRETLCAVFSYRHACGADSFSFGVLTAPILTLDSYSRMPHAISYYSGEAVHLPLHMFGFAMRATTNFSRAISQLLVLWCSDLSSNGVSGTIPTELGKLTRLALTLY